MMLSTEMPTKKPAVPPIETKIEINKNIDLGRDCSYRKSPSM